MANFEKILHVRKRVLKLSCAEVGKQLGMGEQAYTRREKGEVDFSVIEAIKLSQVLKTDKKELFPEFFL